MPQPEDQKIIKETQKQWAMAVRACQMRRADCGKSSEPLVFFWTTQPARGLVCSPHATSNSQILHSVASCSQRKFSFTDSVQQRIQYSRRYMDGCHQAEGWAAQDESGILAPFKFTRRATGPNDVTFKVMYCGICHTDLHELRNQWKNSRYPILPGHEIVGIVTEVGTNVSDFKAGDRVGVGLLVWSCDNCDACHKHQEQYCEESVWSFNGTYIDGTPTYGGYSNLMVTDKRFVFHMPDNLPLDAAAPLLCAGITIYSPMKYFGMTEKGKHFGVVGLGGLGHMAVKFGKAFGLVVTTISTHASKEDEAVHTLGADHFLNSRDPEQMERAAKSMDYIIDTVSAFHSLDSLLKLLKVNGRLILVGLPEKPLQLISSNVVCGRRFVGGSLVGGLRETQEMLNFCGEHGITATIEKVPLDYVNKAMERLDQGDIKYRFVIEIGGGEAD